MRITGNEPSSVILSQKSISKIDKKRPKTYRNKLKSKGWCNKPTKLEESSRTTLPFRRVCLWRHNHLTRETGRVACHPPPCGWQARHSGQIVWITLWIWENLLKNWSNEWGRCLDDGMDEKYLRNLFCKHAENNPILWSTLSFL